MQSESSGRERRISRRSALKIRGRNPPGKALPEALNLTTKLTVFPRFFQFDHFINSIFYDKRYQIRTNQDSADKRFLSKEKARKALKIKDSRAFKPFLIRSINACCTRKQVSSFE